MIDIFCIIVLAVAFYCLLLYLDKRRKQRKDRELECFNTVAVSVKREREEAKKELSLTTAKELNPVATFTFKGYYDKEKPYKTGDLVIMGGHTKCYVDGEWIII